MSLKTVLKGLPHLVTDVVMLLTVTTARIMQTSGACAGPSQGSNLREGHMQGQFLPNFTLQLSQL